MSCTNCKWLETKANTGQKFCRMIERSKQYRGTNSKRRTATAKRCELYTKGDSMRQK